MTHGEQAAGNGHPWITRVFHARINRAAKSAGVLFTGQTLRTVLGKHPILAPSHVSFYFFFTTNSSTLPRFLVET